MFFVTMPVQEDQLWRCSIDRLPNDALEGADLWLMSPPCHGLNFNSLGVSAGAPKLPKKTPE